MTTPNAARPTLAEWQRDLAAHALHGDAAAAARLRPALAAGPVPVNEALEIHASTVHHALYSALRQRVPTVEALVAEDFLRDLVRDFARQHPPRQPQLARWGSGLPLFVATHAGCAALPYLGAVAAFDLALDEVALAPPGQWLPPQPLVAGLTLQRLDSLRVLATTYATDQLRDAVAAARDGDETALSGVSLEPGVYHYALWCAADAQVHCRAVSAGLAAFLTELLGEAAAKADADAHADASAEAQADDKGSVDGEAAVEAALQAALDATSTDEAEAGALFTNLLQELASLGGARLAATNV